MNLRENFFSLSSKGDNAGDLAILPVESSSESPLSPQEKRAGELLKNLWDGWEKPYEKKGIIPDLLFSKRNRGGKGGFKSDFNPDMILSNLGPESIANIFNPKYNNSLKDTLGSLARFLAEKLGNPKQPLPDLSFLKHLEGGSYLEFIDKIFSDIGNIERLKDTPENKLRAYSLGYLLVIQDLLPGDKNNPFIKALIEEKLEIPGPSRDFGLGLLAGTLALPPASERSFLSLFNGGRFLLVLQSVSQRKKEGGKIIENLRNLTRFQLSVYFESLFSSLEGEKLFHEIIGDFLQEAGINPEAIMAEFMKNSDVISAMARDFSRIVNDYLTLKGETDVLGSPPSPQELDEAEEDHFKEIEAIRLELNSQTLGALNKLQEILSKRWEGKTPATRVLLYYLYILLREQQTTARRSQRKSESFDGCFIDSSRSKETGFACVPEAVIDPELLLKTFFATPEGQIAQELADLEKLIINLIKEELGRRKDFAEERLRQEILRFANFRGKLEEQREKYQRAVAPFIQFLDETALRIMKQFLSEITNLYDINTDPATAQLLKEIAESQNGLKNAFSLLNALK